MSQKLPVNGFKWSSKNFEEDIEYPIELHDLHSDLPFLPEKK